jgi:thymidylate synthase (FAD)
MEFVRHRVFSFAQESTRYCNYSKDKFNNECIFIQPPWLDDIETNLDFKDSLEHSEAAYFALIKRGWKPQQARNVLPNALKTELVMTGFASDWEHFFKLRATKAGATGPHPQASELANPLYEEFLKRKYI